MEPSGDKTIEDLIKWADSMAARGTLNPESVRQQKTAIRQLTDVLQPDEPQTVAWVHENLDDLGKRSSNANPKGLRTVATYIAKARALLEAFNEWQADPVHFKPRVKGRSGGDEPRKKARVVEPARASLPSAAVPSTDLPASPVPGFGELRRMRLPEGREFAFYLPGQSFSMNDVQRIACHLLTLAEDFDPSSGVFALPSRSTTA